MCMQYLPHVYTTIFVGHHCQSSRLQPSMQGCTIPMDMDIIISPLPMVASLVESLCWVFVIPQALPTIMELDGVAGPTWPWLMFTK
jgi:hypothetical protein